MLSAGGDLGYTTGPWRYFADATSAEALASGHYFPAWQKQSNGVWKVAADIGVPHALQNLEVIKTVLKSVSFEPPGRADSAESLDTPAWKNRQLRLMDLVDSLDRAGNTPQLNQESRVYRSRQSPFLGTSAIASAWREHGRLEGLKPTRTLLSRCGSLACTHGLGPSGFR